MRFCRLIKHWLNLSVELRQAIVNYASYDNVGNRLNYKIGDANAHIYTYDVFYPLTYVDYNDGTDKNDAQDEW